MSTLNVRNLDQETHDRIREVAKLRKITVGEYLKRLVDLHRSLLMEVDADDCWTGRISLTGLGLEPIRIFREPVAR